MCDTDAIDHGIHTDMTCQAISELESDNMAIMAESSFRQFTIYDREMYVGSPDKVSFYTRLPNVAVLDIICGMIEEYLTPNAKVSKYQQLLLCIIRLRINYLFRDLAYQLNVSVATVQRAFHCTLDLLYTKLSFLIRWPERDQLRKTLPM